MHTCRTLHWKASPARKNRGLFPLRITYVFKILRVGFEYAKQVNVILGRHIDMLMQKMNLKRVFCFLYE